MAVDNKYLVALAVVFASLLVVCLLFLVLWPEVLLPALVIYGIALLAGLQLETFRRLTRNLFSLGSDLNRKIERDSFLNYQQTEALINLLAVVKPELPLPQTRGWAVWPDFLSTLYTLIRDKQPRLILELGSGVSTLVSAYALKQNGGGRIVSLDHIEDWLEATRVNIERHGLSEYVDLLHAPLESVDVQGRDALWYDTRNTKNLQNIDLLVVDGPPGSVRPMARYPAVPLLFEQLSPEPVILVDDANRDDEQLMVKQWLTHFECFEAEFLHLGQGAYVLKKKPSAVQTEPRPVSSSVYQGV